MIHEKEFSALILQAKHAINVALENISCRTRDMNHNQFQKMVAIDAAAIQLLAALEAREVAHA